MKNAIKIITILGIVTSFFPAYSMEFEDAPVCCYCKLDDLKNISLLPSGMSKLPIYQKMNHLGSFSFPILDDDRLRTDGGLLFRLTAMRVFKERDPKKNDQTLKEMRTVIFLGGGDSF